MADVPGVAAKVQGFLGALEVRAMLEDLSVGMINSRKLSVQALVDLNLSVEKVEEIESKKFLLFPEI